MAALSHPPATGDVGAYEIGDFSPAGGIRPFILLMLESQNGPGVGLVDFHVRRTS